MSEKIYIIPPKRVRYLSEISENNRAYDQWVEQQVKVARKLDAISSAIDHFTSSSIDDKDLLVKKLSAEFEALKLELDPKNLKLIENWDEKVNKYKSSEFKFWVIQITPSIY